MLSETLPEKAASGQGWSVERSGGFLTARFTGYLSADQAQTSVEQFVDLLGQDRCVIVFDIRMMTGYDSDARRSWATALRPLRARIERIELLGGNALVRMGGTVLGAMIGVPVSTRR